MTTQTSSEMPGSEILALANFNTFCTTLEIVCAHFHIRPNDIASSRSTAP
jgi:hypothetical protein